MQQEPQIQMKVFLFLRQKSSKKEVGKGAAHLFSLKYTVAVDLNQSNECFMSALKII